MPYPDVASRIFSSEVPKSATLSPRHKESSQLHKGEDFVLGVCISDTVLLLYIDCRS